MKFNFNFRLIHNFLKLTRVPNSSLDDKLCVGNSDSRKELLYLLHFLNFDSRRPRGSTGSKMSNSTLATEVDVESKLNLKAQALELV